MSPRCAVDAPSTPLKAAESSAPPAQCEPAGTSAAAGVPAQLPALAPNGGLSLLVQGKATSTPTDTSDTVVRAGAGTDTHSSARDKSATSPSAQSVASTGTARLSRSVVATMALTTVDLMTATNRRVCHFTLSRPGEPSAHIIPPLMGMQWKFRCDGCDHILFMSSSIVRPSKRSRQNHWIESDTQPGDSDRRPLTARHDRRAYSASASGSTRSRGNSGGDATGSAAAAAVVHSARSPPAIASTPRAGRRSGNKLTGLSSPVTPTTSISPTAVSVPAGIAVGTLGQLTAPRSSVIVSVPKLLDTSPTGALSPVLESSAIAYRNNSSTLDAQGQSSVPLPASARTTSLHLPAAAVSGADSLDALIASPRGGTVKASTTHESSNGATSSPLPGATTSSPQHSFSAQGSTTAGSPTLKSTGSNLITSTVVSTTPSQPMFGRRQPASASPVLASAPAKSAGSSDTASARRPTSSKLSPRGDSTPLKSTGSFHVSLHGLEHASSVGTPAKDTPSFAPAAAWGSAVPSLSTGAVPPPSTRNSSTRKGGFSFDGDAFGSDVGESGAPSKGSLQPIVGLASGLDTTADTGGAFPGFGDPSSPSSAADGDGGVDDGEVDVWAIAPLAEDGAPLTPSGASRNRSGFGFGAASGDDTTTSGQPVQLDVFGKAIKAPVVMDYSKRSGWKSTVAFDKGERWDPDDKRRANQVMDPTDKESLKARLRMLQELVESEDVTHAEAAAATGSGAAAELQQTDDDDTALGDVLCEGADVQPLGALSPAGDDVSLASPRAMPSLTSKRRPSTATRKRTTDASQIVDEDLDASSFVVAGDVLFLEPLDWMGEMAGQMGHLRCPCCDAMLGFYDWAGAVVGTKAKVSPAFCVYTQSVWVQRPPAVSSDQTLGVNTSPANAMTHSVSMPPDGAKSPPRLAATSGQKPTAALTTSVSIAV